MDKQGGPAILNKFFWFYLLCCRIPTM